MNEIILYFIKFCFCLVVTIPVQIAKLHDIEKGDWMEISPIGYEEFKKRGRGKWA